MEEDMMELPVLDSSRLLLSHSLEEANLSSLNDKKKTISLFCPKRKQLSLIKWYNGTSDLMVERSIRLQFAINEDQSFLLRDEQGDLIPVSSSLPSNQKYHLTYFPLTSSSHSMEQLNRPHQIEVHNNNNKANPKRKNITQAFPEVNHSIASKKRRLCSISFFIVNFFKLFTYEASSSDTISFVPNTGKYSLYQFYKQILPAKYQPKGETAFYKVASSNMRLDRQRVTRYYQETRKQVVKYLEYKPISKGPFLRCFYVLDCEAKIEELIKAAKFLQLADLNPVIVIKKYKDFIEGFFPISKKEFLTKCIKETKKLHSWNV